MAMVTYRGAALTRILLHNLMPPKKILNKLERIVEYKAISPFIWYHGTELLVIMVLISPTVQNPKGGGGGANLQKGGALNSIFSLWMLYFTTQIRLHTNTLCVVL